MSEEWLNRRIKEREAADRLKAGLDSLWQNLCEAIGHNFGEYEKATPGEKIEWSGVQPSAVWAKVGRRDVVLNAMTSQRNKLDVKLDRERAEVNFHCTSEPQVKGVIKAGLNDQGHPCFLGTNGKPITTEEAAEQILDLFLFPGATG